MKGTHESEIVLARFEDICPSVNIDNMSMDELEGNLKTGFEIIGYHPTDIPSCCNMAYEKMNGTGELYRFCYNAWRLDDG